MYCILGQGLAGTALAFRFEESGIPFKIIDNGFKSSSSMVAAGLWNPIVFRRINKSYLAEEFLDAQEHFYPRLEKKLDAKFYFPLPLARIHKSKWELDTWFEKMTLPQFENYLTAKTADWNSSNFTPQPFSAHKVNRTGHLDTTVYLKAARRYFLESNQLIETNADLPNTAEELRHWSVAGNSFDRIIDCRGYKSALSQWWEYLPFGLTKGETIVVKCSGLNLKEICNSGFFIIPLGDDMYRVGATFNWDDPTPNTTEAGKQELLEKIRNTISLPFEVIEHLAGVRPTVQDRRPLFGRHPIAKNLFLFNGLGAKGVMMAPYFAQVFRGYLEDQQALPTDTDIARYASFLGKKNPQINHPVP